MKPNAALIAGAAVAMLIAPTVFAQTTGGPGTTTPSATAPPPPPMPASPMPGATTGTASTAMDAGLMNMKIGELEDRDVHAANGEEIGGIDKVVRGPQGLMAVVEAGGGFMGFGSKAVMVPIGRFRMDGDRLMLPMTEDEAKAMPEYRENQDGYAEVGDDDLMLSDALASR